MAFRSLGDFLAELERRGDLVRVRTQVRRDLELTEITRRTLAHDGPALLFEAVEGSRMPVAMNVLGSTRRIALGLGAESLQEAADRIGKLSKLRPPAGVVAALKDPRGTLE